jgi:putative redox protein
MKSELVWKEKMSFEAHIGDHTVMMDAKAPIGQGLAPSPKDLLLSSIAACSAMDVVSHMRKHKQDMKSFEVLSSTETTSGYPAVFKEVTLVFSVVGEIDAEILKSAIIGSQTKYCGVSAMVSKVVPIVWIARLNGQDVATGKADFSL